MRKLAFFSILATLVVLSFNAFSAASRTTANAARGSRATQSATTTEVTAQTEQTQTQQPVAARAARVRSAQKTTVSQPKASATAAQPKAAAARSATNRTKVNAPKQTQGQVAARAGAKQKVINMGTKVEGAAENTVVSEECLEAYYGCMDAFCMLDNTSGGRCQCSDRNTDLDAVLDEIMKLDEQSLAMATEGVERLQMGENAEEIMARAKAAADTVTGKAKDSATSDGSKTVRKLNLTDWRNASLFDDAEEDVFESLAVVAESTLADKTGDALQREATKICVDKIPNECKTSASFLQLTYAQKIKSDCTAYENSLKQQRNASAEKLQTAQKALRDAALEMYQNENKYDFGQCVTQFKSCLQTTAECGEDYSGCIADTAILGELYKKNSDAKHSVQTKDIQNGKTVITISLATYDILNSKQYMCESVTKQCVNANKQRSVWGQVLSDLAPVLYTAEYNAASNNRMNCISTVVSCVQKVCASKWDENTDNYDACLSDPNSIDNYCGLEYRRCGDDASETTVRNYVMAKLSALRVDKCTKDVKACLLAEEHCGPDFGGCIGLDVDTIADLCHDDALLACQDRSGRGTNGANQDVREYISQVAQGIALNIDNKFATACQNAVQAAFERVCGMGGETEENTSVGYCAALDTSFMSFLGGLNVTYYDDAEYKAYATLDQYVKTHQLSFDVATSADNHIMKIFKLQALVQGQIDVNMIEFDSANKGKGDVKFSVPTNYLTVHPKDPGAGYNGFDGDVDGLLAEMTRKFDAVMNQIESDATVKNCMQGRTFQAFSSTKNQETVGRKGRTGTDNAHFPNLTDEARLAIADQVMNAAIEEYKKMYTELEVTPAKLYKDVLDFYMSKVEAKDAELDAINEKICVNKIDRPNFAQKCDHLDTNGVTAEYDKDTNRCTVIASDYVCRGYKNWGWFCGHKCSMHSVSCDHYDGAPGSWCRSSHQDLSFKMSYVNPDTGQVCMSDGIHNATCPTTPPAE